MCASSVLDYAASVLDFFASTLSTTSSFVMLKAAAASGGGAVGRTRSLTVEDLEEHKGCLDLSFGFAYHEIPELCGTLLALELCYSMTRRFLDEQRAPRQEPAAPLLPNWRISGPGVRCGESETLSFTLFIEGTRMMNAPIFYQLNRSSKRTAGLSHNVYAMTS